jgi:hypothetical protein
VKPGRNVPARYTVELDGFVELVELGGGSLRREDR